jgi:hypothetical protein
MILNATDLDQIESAAHKRVAEFLKTTPPHYKTFAKPGAKWRLASGLQKAIRRSNRAATEKLAHAFYDLDAAYYEYRVTTIAVEDVGVANYPALTSWFWALTHKNILKGQTRKDVYIWLAGEMAAGMKDRNATEFMVLGEFAGHEPYAGYLTSAKEGRDSYAAYWREKGASNESLYVMDIGMRRQKSSIPYGIPYVDCLLSSNGGASAENDPYLVSLGDVWFGPYASSALDKHTQEGKKAMRRFLATHPDIEKAFVEAGGDPLQSLGIMLFAMEGSLCKNRLVYAGSRTMIDEAERVLNRFEFNPDQAAYLMELVAGSKEALHEERRKVVMRG